MRSTASEPGLGREHSANDCDLPPEAIGRLEDQYFNTDQDIAVLHFTFLI